MAFQKKLIPAAVALVMCLAVCTPAGAVNLKSAITERRTPGPAAFAETSLLTTTATAVEIKAALQAEIQQQLAEELAHEIAQEMTSSFMILDMVKKVAGDALKELVGGMKDSMGQTCKRLSDIAQSKIDSMDAKLKNISENPNPGELAQGGPDVDDTSSETQPDNYDWLEPSYGQPQPSPLGADIVPANQQRVAWIQTELRDKHKWLFSKIKSLAKKGWSTMKKVGKKVGGVVKKGMKTVWTTVKPLIANGVRSVVAKVKAQVPNLIGSACQKAELKLEQVESKLVGPEEEM